MDSGHQKLHRADPTIGNPNLAKSHFLHSDNDVMINAFDTFIIAMMTLLF